MAEIEVVGVRRIESRGNLRGLADVRIGEIVVNDFRIIKEIGKSPWVSVPQLEYRLHDSGERYYKPLLQIPKDLRGLISALVLREFERIYPTTDGAPKGENNDSNVNDVTVKAEAEG